MSSLVLHSFRRCPFAIRVRMVLEEKDLQYKVIEEDLSAPSADLLRLNPEGKVPVLLHDGRVITESAIITEYLNEVFPQPALMPSSAAGRAEVRLWTHWCSGKFKEDLDIYKYGWNELSEAEQASLLERIRGYLDKMEAALKGQSFLMGQELNLADIHVFPFYRQLQRAKPQLLDFSGYKELNAWLDRIISRPSFLRAMVKPDGSTKSHLAH